MPTLLIKNAHILITMDESRREIPGGSLYIRDGFIEQVGLAEELPQTADEILDLSGYLVMPGLVNTHHHFYQTLTRALPSCQDANLFNWLKTLYPIWGRMTSEDIYLSTQTALAELALSGCTTASDHLYLFPNGSTLDDEIEAAKTIGVRLHASRGSMSLGESKGGLPPDHVVDTEERILSDSARLIEQYHDPNPGSMLQIVLAPCSPFSVTGDLMKESAKLARQYGVHLHTHLAETEDENQFCLEKFGHRPLAYMQSLDWVGHDVWFAHSVWINAEEIKVYAHEGCGVAHCPSSNMRLASGIAPIMQYRAHGVNVGLGVDGSASNDSSHMLAEARMAMLLSRTGAALGGASLSGESAPPLMTARDALEIATLGGAKVLGRDDIGSLAVGKCADLVAIKLNQIDYAGALHDPVAATIFCNPLKVDYNLVHGKFVVRDGELVGLDLPTHVEKHNAAAYRLANPD
ncbi:MAG: 8-oxoguanine deaminase [Anaerolineaceae bacterium]|nr:8-oxoguanine deaminase [Anaerolineaceae bacterium]